MWKEYRDAACHCQKKIHGAKIQLENKLDRNAGDSKNIFFKYIDGKRRCKNNIISLQDEDGHATNRDMGKAEMCCTFFASVFNMVDRPRASQCSVRMTKPSWHILEPSGLGSGGHGENFWWLLIEAILVAPLYTKNLVIKTQYMYNSTWKADLLCYTLQSDSSTCPRAVMGKGFTSAFQCVSCSFIIPSIFLMLSAWNTLSWQSVWGSLVHTYSHHFILSAICLVLHCIHYGILFLHGLNSGLCYWGKN